MSLCSSFYLSLAVGDTVAAAFAIGKESVAAAPNIPNSQREGGKFLLLPKDGDHNVRACPGALRLRCAATPGLS